ncbi:Outer membrane protein OmpA and related peptidoglycan-associated (lipo)proteins (OmpA) (PDB:1OAP) [Commensalibacter communis]|nr:OmpA family protein [Commensalibacter communis]CAI3924752.1 Outer membrane protein OmpA and related peptidoglycan-associated (lipo)proteins (OmpA) (PDB:1OAP) [Commensalibacter communis]CAI3925266.1 Outer membrane protein OmpA and related peptidoglycan-associated (lipo)proteins (OmpA) (PDB:1OAP) [Commensalibacter communis]CAI3937393.1 Outer membrane protein OmpA and related peptidoglycan-associated (lipo)proteins (OmpA) (PDB:1OAP) [Commensalibacter communis]CAI3945390.1 Outer membrane protein
MRRFLPIVFGSLMLAACSQTPTLTPNNDRTYVVFFPFASSELDDAAMTTIDQAVRYAKSFPDKQVYVEGYAAVYGDLSLDEMMAAQRTQAVAQEIVAEGVDKSRVHDAPQQPENRRSQVAARRVEIEVK